MPNRLALAGGWIDQPFVSKHNPKPPGSMVVVQIEPNFRPMDRAVIGMTLVFLLLGGVTAAWLFHV